MAALLDSEQSFTTETRNLLCESATQYAALGFRYHHTSVLFHVAAMCYALGEEAEGNHALTEALAFGATQGLQLRMVAPGAHGCATQARTRSRNRVTVC